MNLYAKLCEREAAGRPGAVGVIGAGKFGTMFLAQARLTRGLHVVGVVDLDPARARAQLAAAGWDAPRYAAASLGEALRTGRTHVGPDAEALFALAELEVIVEATGVPAAGIRHALAAIRHGKHVVMVNVEADALVGPLLARKARHAGVVYSLAWGDQPALICEQVDWAARLRLPCGRSRQGHALRAALPPLDPRHGVGIAEQHIEELARIGADRGGRERDAHVE